jgi:type II secretory pathway pseudopilin PulG
VSILEVVIIVVVVLVVLLAVGGSIATQRRTRAEAAELHAQVERADHALAEAAAQDRGWDRARLEEAARAAFAERHPGAQVRELDLVQVVDRPGTDQDGAVFRVVSDDGEHDIALGRRGDDWVPA